MKLKRMTKRVTSRNSIFGGSCASKEALDDVKDELPKHSRRNGKSEKFKNPDDEEKMSAQSLVGASDYKMMKCGFALRAMRVILD